MADCAGVDAGSAAATAVAGLGEAWPLPFGARIGSEISGPGAALMRTSSELGAAEYAGVASG